TFVGWSLLGLTVVVGAWSLTTGKLRITSPAGPTGDREASTGLYTARMTLQVQPYYQYILFPGANQQDPGSFQRMQAARAKSRLVLTAALKQPKVADLATIRNQVEPIEWLEKEVKADYSAGPDSLTIFMNGDNPEELKILVNAITDAYLNEVVYKE